jgi:hypothetical protein
MTTNEKQLGKLDGKVALITGGNCGSGLATAKQFVNEGAYVFITRRRKSEPDAAVKEIGKNVTAVQGAVANLDDLDRLFAQMKKRASSISCSPTLESPITPRLARSPKSCLTEASLKSESHEYYYRHHRAVADATRLQKEHELQNLDALSHRPVALVKSEGSETEGVRISTVALPGRTKWSPPHDGRDRLVVMLGQTDQLLERDCDTAVPSRWAWVPANSNCKVANAGEQTRNLMIIEFNDVTVRKEQTE